MHIHLKKQAFFFQARLLLITVPLAIIIGSAIALFLSLLEMATLYRIAHPWLLYLLPVAGVLIYFAYKYGGKNSAAGNNLVISQIQTPTKNIPWVMAPLVLISTVVTHLFGGSAGREGTAVQIGGGIASQCTRLFALPMGAQSILLTAGVAAGFAAVFGTPVTGFIFALEVITIGRIRYNAILPALLAATVGHRTCLWWGIQHTVYHVLPVGKEMFTLWPMVKISVAATCFGWAAFLFSEGLWRTKSLLNFWIKKPWLLPVLGGMFIILLRFVVGDDYLGLGIIPNSPGAVSLTSAFEQGGAHTWSWWWKIVFTVVTLASGFKGGEVTPLFFIGAALGNTLAGVLGLPVDMLAAVGFIAVFAAAANTPLACTVMGVELFGGQYVLFFAIGSFIAFLCSGHSGIYTAQLIAVHKNRFLPFEGFINLEQYLKIKRIRENRWRILWKRHFRKPK